MGIAEFAHYSIRAPDLDSSLRFYVGILNLSEGYRPPFMFSGR